MYVIYVNNTLPLALTVHEISRHFWAAYGLTWMAWIRHTQAYFWQVQIQDVIRN